MSKPFLIPVLLFLGLCSACRKSTEIPKPEIYWGEATALKDGKPWKADPFARINRRNEERMDIVMDSLLPDRRIVESLGLHQIPMKPGTYFVQDYDQTLPIAERDQIFFGGFGIRDHDVIYAIYRVLESDSSSNWVTVISVDNTPGGEVMGTFDLTFVASWKAYSYFPDTVRFRDGWFHTRFID